MVIISGVYKKVPAVLLTNQYRKCVIVMIDYNNGVEDMDMNIKNSMFVYFLISYFVIYKLADY